MEPGSGGEHLAHRLVDLVSVALVVTDSDGGIIDANAAACALVGSDVAALRGRSIAWMFARSDGARISALAGRARAGDDTTIPVELAGDVATPVTVRAVRIPGEEVLAWEILPAGESDGILQGVDAALARVAELSALQSVFLAAVGHDLKTPLGAIFHMVDLLEQQFAAPSSPAVPASWSEAVGHARRAAEDMSRVLADLGDVGGLARGTFTIRRERVDVGALVEKIVVGRDFGGRSVTTDVQPVDVDSDPGLLGRAVDNLLTNAIRHTPEGCHVWVVVRGSGGGATIAVEDDGPGLPAWQLQDLLDPGRTQGGGSGLLIVARFVEALGGRVAVEERSGRGMHVRIELPASRPATA